MKCFLLSLLLGASSVAVAQAAVGPTTMDQLHARGFAVLQAEHARAKQPLCPKAENTLANNVCHQRELGISDGNYEKLARALGAMIRASSDTKTPPARIPFDDAETEWAKYREVACTAAGSQFEGGTMRASFELGCQITLVRHHMDELWALYADVETR